MEDIDSAETQFIWNKHGNYILKAGSEKALEDEAEGGQTICIFGGGTILDKKKPANIDA